jgi:hypothetical protein
MPYSQQKIRGFKYTPSIFRRAKHNKCMSQAFYDAALWMAAVNGYDALKLRA